MNASEMIDYAVGQLDGPSRERAEAEAAGDPHLAEALDRLNRAVHQLLDDEMTIEAPEGLADRTRAFVADRRRRRSILEFVPVTVPFRWADVAVAAGIFIASVLTLLPAMHRSKERMDQAGCGFNLQQLGVSLAQYAAQHGHYPYAPPDHPGAEAGTFAVTLRDSNLLHDLTTLDCPCNGKDHKAEAALPHLDKLPGIRADAPDHYRKLLRWDYAYNAGYRHDSGRPGPVLAKLSARIPLVADQPAHEGSRILEGNSPNHGRRGQNVLFNDNHVSWFETRRVSPVDPDLFLNLDNQPAPGLNSQDAALLPSLFPFKGW